MVALLAAQHSSGVTSAGTVSLHAGFPTTRRPCRRSLLPHPSTAFGKLLVFKRGWGSSENLLCSSWKNPRRGRNRPPLFLLRPREVEGPAQGHTARSGTEPQAAALRPAPYLPQGSLSLRGWASDPSESRWPPCPRASRDAGDSAAWPPAPP